MSITADMLRGHTETIILKHLLRGDSYGYEINKEIQEATANLYELNEATLYSAFRRLENNCLINSYWGDEKTGARRRYYTITPLGRKQYAKSLHEWNETKEIIDQLIQRRPGLRKLLKKGLHDRKN